MTLATRCTTCGTIFRVVQDQLRVSNGWVRCGRCGEAFNAVDAMVELPPPRAAMPALDPAAAPPPAAVAPPVAEAVMEQPSAPSPAPPPSASPAHEPAVPDAAAATETDGPPAAGTPPAPEPTTAPPEPAHEPVLPPASEPESEPTPTADMPMIDLPPGIELIASDGAIGDQADVPRAQPLPEAPEATPAPASAVEASASPTYDEAESAPPVADATVVAAPAPATPAAIAESVLRADADEAFDTRAPSFVVAAERAARWRRPGVRLALSLGVVLALAGLAAQGSYVFRDRIAAQAPALRPWLQRGCAALDCRVGDLRQIEVLSVESSGLVRVEGSPVYRLSVTLRNRAGFDVAAPAIDLSLTDAQGQLFSRRVLTMADLDLPLRTLKAGSELPIQVPLGIKDRAVSGYTVEIFYP